MYCRNCGQRYINEKARQCRACGAMKGYGIRYCSKCGFPLQDPNGYCYQCGTQNFQQLPYQQRKSRMVAGILGIFLGVSGAHNFYLGYFLFAIIQASVSALALILCFIPYMWMLGVPVLIGVAVWGIVEGILILTGNSSMDGQGNPLRE